MAFLFIMAVILPGCEEPSLPSTSPVTWGSAQTTRVKREGYPSYARLTQWHIDSNVVVANGAILEGYWRKPYLFVFNKRGTFAGGTLTFTKGAIIRKDSGDAPIFYLP